jgi:hypothetical protein
MLFSKASFMLLSIAASANGQVELGTAAAYGVFGGTTIINTGLTIVNARIGLSPGSSITGFLPGINNGQDINNGAATKAKADIQSAYNALAGLPSSSDLTGTDLGGQTLLPGVYTFTSSGGLTGTLTLDGGGLECSVRLPVRIDHHDCARLFRRLGQRRSGLQRLLASR